LGQRSWGPFDRASRNPELISGRVSSDEAIHRGGFSLGSELQRCHSFERVRRIVVLMSRPENDWEESPRHGVPARTSQAGPQGRCGLRVPHSCQRGDRAELSVHTLLQLLTAVIGTKREDQRKSPLRQIIELIRTHYACCRQGTWRPSLRVTFGQPDWER
jgi:hypothetical protein